MKFKFTKYIKIKSFKYVQAPLIQVFQVYLDPVNKGREAYKIYIK